MHGSLLMWCILGVLEHSKCSFSEISRSFSCSAREQAEVTSVAKQIKFVWLYLKQ